MKVDIFGGLHSPWVQVVLLGLHEKGIDHNLRRIPTLGCLRKWGLFMPAVSIDGSPWDIQSMQTMTKLGYEKLKEDDMRAINQAWLGVGHRADSLILFFAAFARAGDQSESFWKRTSTNFLRSFISLYMYTVLSVTVHINQSMKPKNFGDQFLFWERKLSSSKGPFLDGNAPGVRDLYLFGIVQCHSSIEVPPLEALRRDERLPEIRRWIATMHVRFQDYPYLFSREHFEPYMHPPTVASALQQFVFYFGLCTMIVAFPITLPLILMLMIRSWKLRMENLEKMKNSKLK